MRILLTGASGFLGSALAKYWIHQGHDVVLLLRDQSSMQRLAEVEDSATVVRFADAMQLATAVRLHAPEVIVHTACAYGRQGETPNQILEANVGFGLTLLNAAIQEPRAAPLNILNTATVLAANVSPYALSKHQFSAWGQQLAMQHPDKLQFLDLRLQQMYGPGDDASKFTTHVIHSCRRNVDRLALTLGEQHRDLIHIDDTVRAYDAVLNARHGFGRVDAIDIGTGEAPTMRQFVETVKRLASATTHLDFGAVPYRMNEAMRCQADVRRLNGLGWTPQFDLDTGIRHTLNNE